MKYNVKNGIVWGKYWGGGRGGYEVNNKDLQNFNSLSELIAQAEKELKSGGLDGGMGFECLCGAVLGIETVDTIKKNGKEYRNINYHFESIGKINNNEFETSINNL